MAGELAGYLQGKESRRRSMGEIPAGLFNPILQGLAGLTVQKEKKMDRLEAAKMLREKIAHESTLRDAAIRVKTQEAQNATKSFQMGVQGVPLEQVIVQMGGPENVDPAAYKSGFGQREQVETAKAKVAEDAAKEAKVAKVGPIVEKAMKGETLTGEEYSLAREDVDPIIRRQREDQDKKEKSAKDDAEMEVLAKYEASGMEALTPKEKATVKKVLQADERIALAKENTDLRRQTVEASLADKERSYDLAAKRLALAEKNYARAVGNDAKLEAARERDDARADMSLELRGVTEMEGNPYITPAGKAKIKALMDKAKGTGVTPAATPSRVDVLGKKMDDKTATPEEAQEYLDLTGGK